MSEPLGPRLRRRARRAAERALLRVAGRPMHCAACGRRLFVALPVVWRGRVRIIGAAETSVRVSFATNDAIELRHVELDRCPAPERPWVR
ncbi:MAG TPA: hypothetical protein VF520_14380 [Thermoleophilaceae bacterium]